MSKNEKEKYEIAAETIAELGLDNLPLADKFYNSTLWNQKMKVISQIDWDIKRFSPFVALPFDTYPELDTEMQKAGWVCKHVTGRTIYHPVWYDDFQADPANYNKHSLVPSAEEYYIATLKNQSKYVSSEFSSVDGEPRNAIECCFQAYPIMIEAMAKKGWGHKEWEHNGCVRSVFYPKCAYQDEKQNDLVEPKQITVEILA